MSYVDVLKLFVIGDINAWSPNIRSKTKLNKIIKDKKSKNDTDIREPSFLAIVTGNAVAETRDDGVKIIPIACLKP